MRRNHPGTVTIAISALERVAPLRPPDYLQAILAAATKRTDTEVTLPRAEYERLCIRFAPALSSNGGAMPPAEPSAAALRAAVAALPAGEREDSVRDLLRVTDDAVERMTTAKPCWVAKQYARVSTALAVVSGVPGVASQAKPGPSSGFCSPGAAERIAACKGVST